MVVHEGGASSVSIGASSKGSDLIRSRLISSGLIGSLIAADEISHSLISSNLIESHETSLGSCWRGLTIPAELLGRTAEPGCILR
jgi:hypothetical protein